jgi:hypothetical protein
MVLKGCNSNLRSDTKRSYRNVKRLFSISTNQTSRWDADIEFVPSGRLVGRKETIDKSVP